MSPWRAKIADKDCLDVGTITAKSLASSALVILRAVFVGRTRTLIQKSRHEDERCV
jgi:hypothetical protein